MIIVGLTGSIGSGKSTVADLFKRLGAYVIDWDELARKAVRPHSNAWREIVEHFGDGFLNEDLTLNRQRLADAVFSDKEKVAVLNRIVHPEVFRDDERITGVIRSLDSDALVIKDIPLLYEADLQISLDKTIVVAAAEKTRLRRLEKKGMAREDALNRMRTQLPLEEKTKAADFVIDNDGSLRKTRKQVEALYSMLRRRASRQRRNHEVP
jgi:dephospho-CoA kinase